MGKIGEEVLVPFSRRWREQRGKQASPLDSPILKTGVVRSFQWWLGRRRECMGGSMRMWMWCQRMMNGGSGVLAHVGFMFPHPNNGGYSNLGWLG